MNVVVNINDSVITKCTESVVNSELAIDAKTKLPFSILAPKVCRGFATKALEFILNFTKPVGTVQDIKVNGKEVTYVHLKNVKETAHFFETFKRLGINIGLLTVGISEDNKTLYVSDKLVKDFKRHVGTDTLSAMTMYLITLARFCASLFSKQDKYNIDSYARQVFIDDNFSKHLFSFEDSEYVIDIQGIQSEDFECVYWTFGEYASYDYALAPNAVSLNYNIVEMDSGEQTVVLEFKAGMYAHYFQVFENGMVKTTMDLSYFDLNADSLTRAIMPRFSMCASICHTAKLEGTHWKTLDIDEARDWMVKYIGSTILRAEMTEGISKSTVKSMFDIDIKGSTGGVDAASMKESYSEDEYAQQLYAQAQPYYDTFDLGNLTSILPGFAKGDVFALMFTGESGTGKSTSARVIPYKCGIPYISVNFSVNIEEADLFGSMIPNPTKKDASDPEFIWQDGIITKAIRNGYCTILEEINFARPGVLGKLNSLLDENRQIDLPTGEIVKAHANFRMIATCNIAYEGTNRLNKAFINRFEQVVNFENPTTDVLVDIIKNRTGYTKDANIAKILDVYTALRKFSDEQNLDLVVSVRQLLTIFKQGRYYKTAREAVENIIVNGAFIENPEYASLFKKSVMTAFDLKFKI